MFQIDACERTISNQVNTTCPAIIDLSQENKAISFAERLLLWAHRYTQCLALVKKLKPKKGQLLPIIASNDHEEILVFGNLDLVPQQEVQVIIPSINKQKTDKFDSLLWVLVGKKLTVAQKQS